MRIAIVLSIAICIIVPTVFMLFVSPMIYLYIIVAPCAGIILGAKLINKLK